MCQIDRALFLGADFKVAQATDIVLIIAPLHDGRHHFANEAKHCDFFFGIKSLDCFAQNLASGVEDLGEAAFAGVCQNNAHFPAVVGCAPDALHQTLLFQACDQAYGRRMLKRQHFAQGLDRGIGLRADLNNGIAGRIAEIDRSLNCIVHLVTERTRKHAENIFDEFIRRF